MWAVIVLACWLTASGDLDICGTYVMEVTETKEQCELYFALMGSDEPICKPLFIEA